MNIKVKQILILTALFSAALLMNACSSSESKEKPDEESRAVKVEIAEVKPTPLKDVMVLPGQTEAWLDVRVAADTGGRVEWIGPGDGDSVKKGQLIAKTDVSSLKAALDRAEADHKLAEGLYSRRKALFKDNIIGKEELDRSENQRLLARATLAQTRVEYEKGFVRSPIKGIVNHLYVDAGEFVDRGKPVADLVDVDRIKINVNVPELDVKYLRPGQETMVRIDAFPDSMIAGKVDFVAYKADPATKTFRVRVIISNSDNSVRPGMIARVAFLRRVIPDALVAPLFAIVDRGGERLLFVEEEGVAHARPVTIGVIEQERVQITTGLKEGDHLIVKGQTEVEEGIKVQVQ
ncbi:efflux RND transporter periplasmic adaptor subunit [Thermodesulfobacteriota bacterium]